MLDFVRNLWAVCRSVNSTAYLCRAKMSAYRRGGKVIVGSNVYLAVPVRTDGRGEVDIGGFTKFGFDLAPRFGSGEILLQAREYDAVIQVGEKTSFSNNVSIIARKRIEFGAHCLIGDRVTVMDSDFHVTDPDMRLKHGGTGKSAPVVIG